MKKKLKSQCKTPLPIQRTNCNGLPTLEQVKSDVKELTTILTTSTGNIYLGGAYAGRTPWFDEEEQLLNTIL